MTTGPQTRPPAAMAGRPPTGGGGAPMAPTIDPVKLVLRYKWLLAASVFVGVGFGVFLNIVLGMTVPIYVSEAIFEVKPPPSDVGKQIERVDGDELERYMNTQVATVTSPTILERVARDPRIQTQAKDWADQFRTSTGFDYIEARLELEEIVSARVLLDTTVFSVSVRARTAATAMALATLVQDVYAAHHAEQANLDYRKQTGQLLKRISATQTNIDDLQSQKQQKIKEEDIEALATEKSTIALQLRATNADLQKAQSEIASLEEARNRMRTALETGSGLPFTATQRQYVDSLPILQRLKNSVDELEVSLQTITHQGIQPGHRAYRRLQDQIDAAKAQLESRRTEELRRAFDAELDQTTSTIDQLKAVEADLQVKARVLEQSLTTLQSTLTDIAEINDRLDAAREQRSAASTTLAELEGVIATDGSKRVALNQPARTPDKRAFPEIVSMVIVGVFSICGLSAVVVVTREILDQRVKGPSDVAMIPRAKVVGLLPLAAEDPDNPKRIETIFRDAPQGVMAESFRQIRTGVSRRMTKAGHKTLMIVPGMPGSGATSVATNLAFATAAADRRVLLVDTNFRRPALHKIFGLEEQPGLAGVLAGEVDIDKAIRSTDTPGVDVLPVGGKEHRVFEQLGSSAMRSLLEKLKERYDLILLDTAPAVVSGDALALASLADAALLVVRAMSEKRGMVARIRNELDDAHADLLGVMVNAVRASAGGYMRKNIRATFDYQSEVPDPADSDTADKAAPPSGGEPKAA